MAAPSSATPPAGFATVVSSSISSARVNTNFLSPYLDFANGANFAVVGSFTLPKYVPFSLNIQVMQFLHFKARNLELATTPGKESRALIGDDAFWNALYIIDIADSFAKNMSYAQVVKRIPTIITEIKKAVTTPYNQGARKFWVHNTGPLGCLPQMLSLAREKDVDQNGCLSGYNSAARLFNEGLLHLCRELRSQLKDTTIVYVDIYSIEYDLIANSTSYGFSSPLMTCCGNGGPPYNYNIRSTCGNTGREACADGSKFLSWDGIHLTEAANSIISSKILSMDYSDPCVPFDLFCRP